MTNSYLINFLKIWVFFGLLGYHGKSFSESRIDTSESFSVENIKFLEDPEGIFSIEEVNDKEKLFKAMEPGASFGITQSVFG